MFISGTSLGGSKDYSKKSKLCRSLDEIIRDHEAVPYLIQYLESCKAAALLRFWLDSESFQASTWTRIRTHSLQSVSKSLLVKNKDVSSESLDISINKDITSPDSVDSLESETHIDQSKSSGALSQTILDSEHSTKLSFDTEQQISADSNSEVTENQSSDSVLDNQSETVTESIQNGTNSCDSRDREKCKMVGSNRDTLSLPLSPANCDNSNQRAESAKMECAISYRDITTPSPTNSTQDVLDSSIMSGSSTQSKTTSSSSLAEKLKKSKPKR